jgi:hypothetical protein
MSLKQQLATMKAASAQKMPPESLQIIQNARLQLQDSGLIDKALKTGDNAPCFKLSDHLGQPWSLADLRQHGPVVLTFFRGVW